MKIAGVDEAGRGPVIGPMVIVGVVIKESKLDLLSSLDVRDSKMLSPQKRESLYPELLKILDAYKIVIVQPHEIDARFSKNLTMNSLELKKMAKIIVELNPDVVYVDCPDIKPDRFSDELKKIVKKQIKIVAAHNADKKYPIVSAASIIAKVTRDRYMKKYASQYGDVGSGYPSDPKTISFLRSYYKKYHKWPAIVRKTWSTVKIIEAEVENMEKQRRLDSFI